MKIMTKVWDCSAMVDALDLSCDLLRPHISFIMPMINPITLYIYMSHYCSWDVLSYFKILYISVCTSKSAQNNVTKLSNN